MAVQEAGQCDTCAHGAREGHRRAVAEFLAKREEFAAGEGLPAGVAHSPGASRQWVSDELTQSARTVAGFDQAASASRLRRVRLHTLAVVWGCFTVLVVGQTATAIGTGWTPARTAGLLAAFVVAGILTGAAYAHRKRGGILAVLTGEDNRLSTSRTVAAAWLLVVCGTVLHLAVLMAGASSTARRDRIAEGLSLAAGGGLLCVLAVVCAIAVAVRRTVAVRVAATRLQKVRADHPRAADVLCDDSGRASFTDGQYVLVNAAAVVLALSALVRAPERLPQVPWGLVLLVALSGATYLAGKYAEGGRPVVMAVVRAREAGDLDGPIRTGDDIEIRGTGFVPPGADRPDLLAKLVVRFGAVHVHVPLIPVAGGFANPADTLLTVPVPVDVEPGPVDVQVVTAAGVTSNRCLIEISD
ncbi:hypothetical protein ACLB9X_21020 [Streptomyces sp. 5K101]|uniref:hypothetical protein n=1 Tax=Streptomyces sp. 5K101 TaxID=3390037 RepID=UPI003975DDA5